MQLQETYRGVPMGAALARALAAQEAKAPLEVGPLLAALARVMQGRQLLAVEVSIPAALWLAAGAAARNAQVELWYRTTEDALAMGLALAKTGLARTVIVRQGVVVRLLEELTAPLDLVLCATEPTRRDPFWERVEARLAPHALLAALDADSSGTVPLAWQIILAEESRWRTMWLDGNLFLAGHSERTVRQTEGPRIALTGLLLELIQPATLALGPDVVFDAALKPRATRINFSGAGGQIGPGDMLLIHARDLNRYTPLPGAVALVFGALTEPVQALAVPITLSGETVTLLVKD